MKLYFKKNDVVIVEVGDGLYGNKMKGIVVESNVVSGMAGEEEVVDVLLENSEVVAFGPYDLERQ